MASKAPRASEEPAISQEELRILLEIEQRVL